MSPLPFALVLLSIEWARCLGEMIMVRRNPTSPCIGRCGFKTAEWN
jgi:hypothetical protein